MKPTKLTGLLLTLLLMLLAASLAAIPTASQQQTPRPQQAPGRRLALADVREESITYSRA